jgi:hypothetical protein
MDKEAHLLVLQRRFLVLLEDNKELYSGAEILTVLANIMAVGLMEFSDGARVEYNLDVMLEIIRSRIKAIQDE